MLPTNEQVALWIDPEKQMGWWHTNCPECGFAQPLNGAPMHAFRCRRPSTKDSTNVYTGPDFTQPGPCAEFVEPFLDLHDVWRTRGNHRTTVWYSASAHYNEFPPAIEEDNHQHACLLAMGEVMKNAPNFAEASIDDND